MCLDLRKNHGKPFTPIRKKGWNIRYKDVLQKEMDHYNQTGYLSTRIIGIKARFQPTSYYPSKILRAKGVKSNKTIFGFHCYISKGKDSNRLQVLVRGFLASGHFHGTCCETWSKMKITKKEYNRVLNRLKKQNT